jgi:hypothetical protein
MRHYLVLFFFVILPFSISWAIPLKIVPGDLESGKIFIPCEFDNFSDTCFLDTGATFSAVANLNKFGAYPVVGKVRFKSAGQKAKEVDEIAIRKLKIGETLLKNTKVARLDPKEGFKSVIGMNTLSNLNLNFHFKKEASLIFDDALPGKLNLDLLIYDKNIFSIPTRVGTIETKALWDTGAGLTTVDEQLVKSNPSEFKFVMDIPTGKDATGNPVVMKLYTVEKVVVGGIDFQNVKVLAIDFGVLRDHVDKNIRMIVGFNLITKADWYFDFKTLSWGVK